MVTGKSHVEITGRRTHGRIGKKKGRRDRHAEVQRQVDEDEDSSDLSDDSDEDGENMQRWVISFRTMCGLTF
jgi:hypothetical protein